MFVGHDGNAAPGDRQDDVLADHALVAGVLGVDGHGHVGQHGFRARGGDHDMVGPVIEAHTIGQRIAEPPEAALDLARFDFEVGNRGLELGVPVHQPLVAVDQALIVEVDEDLDHRAGEVRVHRELFAAPVHRAAQAAQLARDRAAAFRLPFPHLGDELLAGVVGALVTGGFELALDDHLRGDARMVGADHPQGVLALEALVTDHDVLKRVVERVADVERAGYVGRRVYDGKRLGLRALGTEQAALLPMLVPARLDGTRFKGLGQLVLARFRLKIGLAHGVAPCHLAGFLATMIAAVAGTEQGIAVFERMCSTCRPPHFPP